MLKKLLKYEFKGTYKVWLICIAAATFFAIVFGILVSHGLRMAFADADVITVASSSETVSEETELAQTLGSILSTELYLILGTMTFYGVALSFAVFEIYYMYRFYTDFYTDVGYLTFTLPIPRKTLLNSKFIGYLLWSLACFVMVCIYGLIIFCMLPTFPAEFTESVGEFLTEVNAFIGAWKYLYTLEGFVLFIAAALLSAALLYFCITIGAVIAKKHKLLAAVGIYFAASFILSTGLSILIGIGTFGAAAGTSVFADITATQLRGLAALLLFGSILLTALLFVLLYNVTLRKLETKLNLP